MDRTPLATPKVDAPDGAGDVGAVAVAVDAVLAVTDVVEDDVRTAAEGLMVRRIPVSST